MPFPRQRLKVVLSGQLAGDLVLLFDQTGIDPFGDHPAGIIPLSSRFFQRHLGIDAQGERFLLAAVAVLEPPILAGLIDQQEQPLLVGQLLRLAVELGLPSGDIG
ncbi:hypothetical protein D3C84_638120 [compost metagenome]